MSRTRRNAARPPGRDPSPPADPVPGGASNPSPPAPRPVPGSLDRAVEMVHFLRAHCPWDAVQTPASLVPYLLEESHEVVDAIGADDPRALEGELGDLLLNLAFQVAIGEEKGHFHRESVTARMEEKMRRRHPHLFGLGEAEGWEALKARERREAAEGSSILSGIPPGMDPLMQAHRIQEKVSGVGFDWDSAQGAWEKVSEEVGELREAMAGGDRGRLEEEVGDLLFAMVNLSRLTGVHPTVALERANRKFRRRFQALEELARERGILVHEAGLEVLDRLWDEVKAGEGEGAAEGAEGLDEG